MTASIQAIKAFFVWAGIICFMQRLALAKSLKCKRFLRSKSLRIEKKRHIGTSSNPFPPDLHNTYGHVALRRAKRRERLPRVPALTGTAQPQGEENNPKELDHGLRKHEANA